MAAKFTLRRLARRYQELDHEISEYDSELSALADLAAPGLLAVHGVGPETAARLLAAVGDNPERLHSEAAFAHLCDAAPIPASSGRRDRHRLNRGGNRSANAASTVNFDAPPDDHKGDWQSSPLIPRMKMASRLMV
ncbi:transposase [Streptomyces sp. NPDC005474]|uniref:transposase n=1 Tax=Streptomyces sp. NPDC005474 TaxID=3154878 RepID=UPI003455CF4A